MASVPLQETPRKSPLETVEQRFRRLESVWSAETGYLSNPTEIVNHAAFQEIIRMGEAVGPIPCQFRSAATSPR